MNLSNDDVTQIVREVWSSMLGLEVAAVDLDLPTGEPSVAGSVGVQGATECLISLEMAEPGARLVGASMFGLDEADVSDDDVGDAIGELTNMVGGNIKSLLPEPSTLSLPVVASGKNPTLKVFGGQPLMLQTFLTSGQYAMSVTVYNRTS